MKITSTQFATAAIFFSLLATIMTTHANAQDRRSVSVTGTVAAKVRPDTLTWSIQVRTENPELDLAKTENDESVKPLIGLRETLGLKPDDLQTGYLTIRKVYHKDDNGNRGDFRFFAVTRAVSIKQSDIDRFDEMFEQLSSMKNIEFSYSLSSSRFHEVRRETRIKAVKVARDKAKEMAECLNATLGEVLTIEETKPSNAQIVYSNSAYTSGDSVTEDELSGTFAPGSVSIRVSVDVSFAIE